jgi:hypothetical protein
MATNIVSHTGKNRDWICYKNGANRMTLTFTENSAAKDMTAYTFVVNIRKWGSSTNELQLTQGAGITNGGSTGVITIDLTKTQASTTLPGDSYFYEVVYTYDSNEYALIQKGLQLLAQGNSEDTTTSLSFTVTLAGASEVDVAVTLVGVTSAAIATAHGTQSANVVYSGPSSGIAADPAFRALVAGDIPADIARAADLTAHTSDMNSPHGPGGQEYFRTTSGRYYGGSINGALSTMPMAANQLRAWPFIVTKQITVDEIRSEVTTASASTTYRIGIYDSDASNSPANLIANSDTGTFDSATTGVKSATFAANIILAPGLYWFVINSNGGATLRAYTINSNIGVLGFKGVLGAQAAVVGFWVSYTYAAMPASYPVGRSDLDANTNIHLVVVKVV